MKRLHDIFAILFGGKTHYEKEIMRLARVEYGRDWQYAYYALLNGEQPSIGVKQ